jgi:multiple sugar transport system ATP-binding protein
VVEQVGPPLELYRRPATRFVATFLGSPAMNLWPGERAGDEARVPGCELRVPAGTIPLPAGAFTIGVRPEDVALARAAGPATAPAEVLVVEPMGSETIATLQCGAARVVARGAADFAFQAGETAFVSLAPARAHFFDQAGRRLG